MSIVFNCDRCDERITVEDNLEGHDIECPACGIDLTVPTGRSPQPGSEPSAVWVPPSGRGGHLSRPHATARRLFGFVGWSGIVVGLISVLAGIIAICNTPAVGEGHLLYFWTITLLPGIAAFLAGVLVLAVRSWFRDLSRLLDRSASTEESQSSDPA